MKKLKIVLLIAAAVSLVSCSQYVDNRDTSGTNTTGNAYIKFFNPVNFGNLSVTLNGVKVDTLYQYGTTTYYNAISGSNNITIRLAGYPVLSLNTDLIGGTYYSCFFYKVGYDWKMNIVKDDLTSPGVGKTKVRVLDFRTQAYYDFVRLNVFSVGVDQFLDSNRHFLDHATYTAFANFKTVTSNTNYNIYVYNDTANLVMKKAVPLNDRKIYSLILTTDATLSSSDAIKKIGVTVEAHN